MDNRLRFRAWNTDERIMRDIVDYWVRYDRLTYVTVREGDDIDNWFDNFKLMQCTGLTAAKSYRGEGEADRLVFEGDIVMDFFGKHVITWLPDEAKFAAVTYHKTVKVINSMQGMKHREIIGNVHEHPELLGGEEG